VTACLLVPAVAASAPTTIATLHTSTAVEAYGDVVAWSDYVATDRSWHIVVQRDGQISTLPSPTATKTIEVDVGPDSHGVPKLAYVSCTGSCHVVVSAVDGSDPQMVPGSARASHPTIWGNNVAWVSAGTKVLISRRNGSGRRMLGGAPRRKCYYSSLREPARLVCGRPQDPHVDALQLSGRQLALVETFVLNDHVGAVGTTTEVRTEAIGGGSWRCWASARATRAGSGRHGQAGSCISTRTASVPALPSTASTLRARPTQSQPRTAI
jgi:hypothetical protein